MKAILNGLLVVTGLTNSIASADFLGEADDTYLGMQMTMPLEAKSRHLFSGHKQYSYLLIEQKDGIKDGIVLTLTSDGNQILNYLRPSTSFDINESRISEYAVPIMRLDAQAGANANQSTKFSGVGLVALFIGLKIKHDLDSSWRVAD